MTTLSLKAKQDHIEKVVRSNDPLRGIAELVWNGLDAKATRVEVRLEKTSLDGIDGVVVTDNGHGISPTRAATDFEQLGESWKKTAKPTPRGYHGKEGRGRLRFFSIADRATWASRSVTPDGMVEIKISVRAESLDKCDISEPVSTTAPVGTTVSLHPLKGSQDWLGTEDAFDQFSSIYAQYLRLHGDVEIVYNGKTLDPNTNVSNLFELPAQVVVGPTRTIRDLNIQIVEWNKAVESRKIHFCGDDGIVLGSQPARVTAPDFFFSIYATSAYFKELAAVNVLELDDLTDPDFAAVLDSVRLRSSDYFRTRAAQRSLGLIDQLKKDGLYPYQGDPIDDVERRERQVFDIATYAVSSYSREFRRAEDSLKKMTLALLREALTHNPDSISKILRAVIKLPKDKQNDFSQLLEQTALSNIITASSLIADRVAFLQTLDQAVFHPEWKKTIRERGGLDALVQDNTWIFGEQFHIALHEAGLSRVVKRLAEDIGTTASGKVRNSKGKISRLDTLLARIPTSDTKKREYLVVELKRPTVTAGKKELDQILEYARTLVRQQEFAGTDTRWTFFLVVNEYDDSVSDQVNQNNRPSGLAVTHSNYEVWVKKWSEVIRDCESRLQFIQDQLKVDVTDEMIDRRLRALQDSLTKVSPDPE